MFHGIVSDARGVLVIGLDGGDRLRMDHFSKSSTHMISFFGVGKDDAQLGFGGGNEHDFHDNREDI